MAHDRKWFYVLEAQGESSTPESFEPVAKFIGFFASIEAASAYLMLNGLLWAASVPEFSRFSLGKQRVNNPQTYQFLMSLDVDGDRVEPGWTKVKK